MSIQLKAFSGGAIQENNISSNLLLFHMLLKRGEKISVNGVVNSDMSLIIRNMSGKEMFKYGGICIVKWVKYDTLKVHPEI